MVSREPGNKYGVRENVVVSAPVNLGGVTRRLVVTLHVQQDGTWHYDFGYDREDKKSGGPGVNVPEGTTESLPVGQPASQSTASGINLTFERSENNAGRGMSPERVRSALDQTALAGPIKRLIDAGKSSSSRSRIPTPTLT